MRTDDFWAVIDRATADRPASPGEVAKRATADLAARDPEEIVAWARHLDKVMVASGTQDLWAAATAGGSAAVSAASRAYDREFRS